MVFFCWQGNRGDAPTRPAGSGDVEMGIVPPPTEPADKHMEEFFKEVSLIKVGCLPSDGVPTGTPSNGPNHGKGEDAGKGSPMQSQSL